MGKRTVFEANPKAAHTGRHAKRQKTDDSYEQETPAGASIEDEVTSARQLQNALVFDQGSASAFRSGLSLAKRFLDAILYATEEDALPRKRAILREYLDTQKEQGKAERDTTLLSQFTQAWDYAAETNFEPLLAQVTAVLALLLKVFATHAEFTPYGSLLCKTILQPNVARRLVRSLSAPTSKEQVILPALRLLIQITTFNEGAFARTVYARKDFTLEPKILARNIATWKDSQGQTALELQRKPSIRTTSVRYLLAHLKYQDERAKIDIVSNKDVVRAVLDHLTTDPPFLIAEIFSVFTDHVFLDKAIPRHVKSRMLNGRALTHIAGLYRYEAPEGSIGEGERTPDARAHDFLSLVCTSPAYGIMLPTQGFYPHTTDDDEGDAIMEDAEPLLRQDWSDQKPGPVRNLILADFLQSLRPYANILHQELVTKIFAACPELIANYFHQKQDFNYDPKLTSTWIGFSAFLYRTIEIDVPQFFGASKRYRAQPPPIAGLLQSILPQPLTQNVLVKCLNAQSDLISFFAVRVLVVAFYKLRAVLKEFENARAFVKTFEVKQAFKYAKLWETASERLITNFSQRCPPMKVVIKAFHQPAFQKGLKREAVTRLLRLYYEVTPRAALAEKFDVSVPLCNALTQAERLPESAEDKAFCVMELEHWIQMASHTPSMRWWQKNKSLQHSPFVMLLKLLASSAETELYAGIKVLLAAIVRDNEMLQKETSPDALDALIASLSSSCGTSVAVLDFIDECCSRFIKLPVKYFDDIDTLCQKTSPPISDAGPVSPLLMTLVEQWPFKGGKPEKGNPAEPLSQWLSKLLYLLKLIGEDEAVLKLLRDSLVETADKAYQDVLKDSFQWKMGKEKAKEALKLATGADFSGSERSTVSPAPVDKQEDPIKAPINLELPPVEDKKHVGLNRWRKKDIEEAVDDGDVGELILCLCSQHPEIRLQAASNTRQLMAVLDKDQGDLQQLYLLLGELLESAEPYTATPFPYIGGVFAARCVPIIADPTHFLFPKINAFLTSRPAWSISNLPRKFCRTILLAPPDEDGFYHKEVDWFLDYLIDALRTPADMEIFRTTNMFERVISYYSSKSCSIGAKEKIVRLLLRAASVEGATTLITRCGVVAWVRTMLEQRDYRGRALKVLVERLWAGCDKEKVGDWSSGSLDALMTRVGNVKV
ncbi:hypothetical protein P280DRAFT_417343 [Massarina eburnea CBS 473.64]|uniref:Ribosome biogenesis protein Urb1 n=1 Tax=Massarina eburnea CBS 473.64 TaxID=1395130 RepID=A0A6A6SDZ4_9PLEO|nr:hypothetical protein P280DRAFT_417343 [Massarina eburnea CBS 473.64]